MTLASPRTIVRDATLSRNHVWLTTGIRAVYQRDNELWTQFDQLWEDECNQIERWRDETLPAAYRGRIRDTGGVVFMKGTDNQQLFDRIRGSNELVEVNGIAGRVVKFYADQLATMEAPFLSDIEPVSKNAPLVIAGHSYGGVMALLLGLRAQASGWSQVFVYTYGMPRPGNRAFNEGNEIRHFRSVIAGDGVTEYGTQTAIPTFPPYNPLSDDVDAHSNHGRKYTLSMRTGMLAEADGIAQEQNSGEWNEYASQLEAWKNNYMCIRNWLFAVQRAHPIRTYQLAWVLNHCRVDGGSKPVRVDLVFGWPFPRIEIVSGFPQSGVLNFHRMLRRQEEKLLPSERVPATNIIDRMSNPVQTVVTRAMFNRPAPR